MQVSEARRAANIANAQRSTGPRTAEGKAASRRNGLVHGLTGEGVVVPEADAPEVARRAEDLMGEFHPKSPMGQLMIPRLALLSVRMERAASRELLAAEGRARRAGDDFDEARHDEVDRLIEALADDPRSALRKLKQMPEGVIRLVGVDRPPRRPGSGQVGPRPPGEAGRHGRNQTVGRPRQGVGGAGDGGLG